MVIQIVYNNLSDEARLEIIEPPKRLIASVLKNPRQKLFYLNIEHIFSGGIAND
jgi:hypothetical protein